MTPVQEIAAIACDQGALIILDAAQSAGSVEIDVASLGVDGLAAPGHKGLCGPVGTGVLVLSENLHVASFREGGSGVLVEGFRAIDDVRIFGPAARPETAVISFRIDGVDVALAGTPLTNRLASPCVRDCIARRRRIGRSVPPEGTV
jgi:selenocysteine lyase/cysteine desulfurase